MPLALMQASTEDPYPLALSNVDTQTNSWFPLRFKKVVLLPASYSMGTLCIASGDNTQIYAQNWNTTKGAFRVAPVVGFNRTGKVDTSINVVLTGYQWDPVKTTWLEMCSWLEQIPANVGSYVIPFAPTYRFSTGYWTYFKIALEHAYSAEGVTVNQWYTFIEVTAV